MPYGNLQSKDRLYIYTSSNLSDETQKLLFEDIWQLEKQRPYIATSVCLHLHKESLCRNLLVVVQITGIMFWHTSLKTCKFVRLCFWKIFQYIENNDHVIETDFWSKTTSNQKYNGKTLENIKTYYEVPCKKIH